MKSSSSHAVLAGLLAVALGGGCSVFSTPDVPLQNPKRYRVSGTISGAVASGVAVKLSGAESASTTTDAQGKYSFGPLGNGTYSVAPSLGGYVFEPASAAVPVDGADVEGKDFVASATSAPTHRISGIVSGAVAAGVTITLSGAGNPSTVTDGNGTFEFGGLVDGEYTLTPAMNGFGFDPAALPVTLSGMDVSGAVFTASALDWTPPKVVSQTPAPGDANVWVKAPIQVTFDEPIRLPQDSAVSVSGAGSLALAKTLSLSGDGKTLTIALPSPPSAPNAITVALNSGITDLAGNPLMGTSWSFAMPVWWSPWPDPLELGSFGISLALGPNGEPIIAQTIPSGQTSAILVQKWDGSRWDQLGARLQLQASAAQPILKTDSAGHLFLAWTETASGKFSQVFVAKWNGSTWLSPNDLPLSLTQGVSANTGGGAANPALGLSNGTPVIAWTELVTSATDQYGTANLFVKRWTGSAWTDPLGGGSLNQTATNRVRHAAIETDQAGNPIVVWTEYAPASSGSTASNAFARKWDGSRWTSLGSTINDPGTVVMSASLTKDPTGAPLVAIDQWAAGTASPPGIRHVIVKRWTGLWTTVGNELNSSSSQSAGAATIATSTNGRAVVVFSEGGDTANSYTVRVRELVNGTWESLGSWTGLSSVVPALYSAPFVAVVDGSDTPIVGWHDDWPGTGTTINVETHLAIYNR